MTTHAAIFLELVQLANTIAHAVKQTSLSASEVLRQKEIADGEGRELTPEYLASLDAKAQASIDRLKRVSADDDEDNLGPAG